MKEETGDGETKQEVEEKNGADGEKKEKNGDSLQHDQDEGDLSAKKETKEEVSEEFRIHVIKLTLS